MAQPAWWRRVRAQFGISAPRMSVRTHIPWWGRGAAFAFLVLVVAAMWWWGFDFGQIFGGFHRRETETRLATLESQTRALQSEAASLRARNSELESELAMARGAREATGRQLTTLSGDNVQLKEEVAFLQQLVADSNTQAGMSMPRIRLDRQSDETWHYSLLIVRGGNPRDEFAGRVVLQATLASTTPGEPATHTLTLPDDQPETAPALKLAFKYYQRVEGTFKIPAGTRVTTLAARAFEDGSGSPRVSRTLANPLTNP